MNTKDLIKALEEVIDKKSIEIKNKRDKEIINDRGEMTYSSRFEHGVDVGYILLARDVLKILQTETPLKKKKLT